MQRIQRTLLLIFLAVAVATTAAQGQQDTLVINGITVIRDNKPVEPEPKKRLFKGFNTKKNLRNIATEWGMIDIGMSNFTDATDYASAGAQEYAPGGNEQWFAGRYFKSRNINIWLVTQRYNLVRHFVNLQYGLGLELNNYWFKNPVRFNPRPATDIAHPPIASIDETPGRSYRKNKLAADYITVPLMLNFNLTPNRLYPFELSTGISVGYLYASRNKTISSDGGKQKAKGDFDLDPWKLSYVGDITLGVVTLYGSYAFKSMYKRGLDHTPYNFGIRLRPADFFGKIQN
ncbi:outer membrane beta-barrel protein [Niabella hirudinis]|uniref:outer membrane beta-barrel protein n=1 Tax=Niabella hirudinis TaxID=1285929 RepID=UPI003EBD308F